MPKKIAIACISLFLFFITNAIGSQVLEAEKIIILTFDDGPRPRVLKHLLPLLQKYSVSAVFFMVGAEISQNDGFVKEMHKNGHEIENHSWGHENFIRLLKEKGDIAVKLNLEKTNNAISKITGKKPKFFRPPFWEINDNIERIVRNCGLTPMKLDNPDINTLDYDDFSKHRSATILINRVKKNIERREKQNFYRHVLVFHELPLTIEALDVLIPHFQGAGYKFIRLDQRWKVNVS